MASNSTSPPDLRGMRYLVKHPLTDVTSKNQWVSLEMRVIWKTRTANRGGNRVQITTVNTARHRRPASHQFEVAGHWCPVRHFKLIKMCA